MCTITGWLLLIMLVMCSISDWKKKEIPLWMLLLFSVAVVGILFLCPGESAGSRLGGATIGILLFGISKCTKEAVGYGDSWIILLLGLCLGGPKLLQVLLAASLAAGICSVFFLWKLRWRKNATLPFIPFLTLAYLGVMFT